MNTEEKNKIYAQVLIKYGYDLNKDWFKYKQSDLMLIDELAEAFNIKPSAGRCAGRTLWDRARKGRPF